MSYQVPGAILCCTLMLKSKFLQLEFTSFEYTCIILYLRPRNWEYRCSILLPCSLISPQAISIVSPPALVVAQDANGLVERDEFVKGCMNLIGTAKSLHLARMTLGQKHKKVLVDPSSILVRAPLSIFELYPQFYMGCPHLYII